MRLTSCKGWSKQPIGKCETRCETCSSQQPSNCVYSNGYVNGYCNYNGNVNGYCNYNGNVNGYCNYNGNVNSFGRTIKRRTAGNSRLRQLKKQKQKKKDL